MLAPLMPSSYRWVIVALGGLMGCVAIGAMFSLAVFLAPISAATGWGRATISSAMTLNFLVMCGLLVQAIAICAYLVASRRSGFYVIGIVFGAATVLSSLGMALGPVAGGWVFDTCHDYRWLYFGSTAIALAAAAVAFTFPSPRRVPPPSAAT